MSEVGRVEKKPKFGVLTVSDRCSSGECEDTSGPALIHTLSHTPQLKASGDDIVYECVPDDVIAIQRVLLNWTDKLGLCLILTTGGTGFSPRDITPEATRPLIEKEAPGIVVAMVTKSLAVTPMAMLSRPVAGVRKNSLIMNLPGSKKGSGECLQFILSALPHALDLLSSDTTSIEHTHSHMTDHMTSDQRTHKCPQHHDKKGKRSRSDFTPVSQRSRHSPYPMLPVREALDIVLSHTHRNNPIQSTNLDDALGCVLSESVKASLPIPPFPASIKDGYAVISLDGPGERKVLPSVTAGEETTVVVRSGFVSRITTGAPLPSGADAVVQVEDTELIETTSDGDEEAVVRILSSVQSGCDVRKVGVDITEGQEVLQMSERLGPAELGLLAAIGVTKVNVFAPPTVAVLSTGNEVMSPGSPLASGQIYDSNRTTLLSAVRNAGARGLDMGIARDNRESLVKVLSEALDKTDIVVTSGGVSMGEKDLLKPVLEVDFKATIHFGRVHMKPGKPTTFAILERNGRSKLVFALPGNPVSCLVTFYLFVVPCLRKMAGWTDPHSPVMSVKLAHSLNLDPRPEYHRASLTWSRDQSVPIATSTGSQCSSRLSSMRSADVLLLLPGATKEHNKIDAGTIVSAMVINKML